jgi:hypothetical protein
MRTSDSIGEVGGALAAAQGEMSAAKRDGKNSHYGNRYTTLDSLLDAAKPALSKHGISVIQASGAEGVDHKDADIIGAVTTRLVHKSGEWIESTLRVPLADRLTYQEVGKALTYLRRYSLAGLVGIAGEVDDDGETDLNARQRTATAGGSKAAPPKRARQGTAKPELDAGEGAPSPAPPAGDRVEELLLKRVNSGVSKRGTQWAIGTFLTRGGEELRCGTFSKTWVDCLINEQRNDTRVWQLTLAPPKKDGDAWQIETLKWVTEGGELVDPDMQDVPF